MIDGKRIHGLDALRAVAMLLGILLHATIAYRVENAFYWVHDNEYNNISFDFVYFFIHSFRMPLFFLIAGFFCRFLYNRKSEKEFIKNRWTRVGLPFIAGVILIVPLTMFPFRVYEAVFKSHLPWNEAYRKSFFQMFGRNGLAHLWFLYDLMMFYAVVIVLKRACRFSPVAVFFKKFSNWWNKQNLNNIYWILIFSISIFLILIKETRLFILADTSVIPEHISYLFFYGYFFTTGWLFHKRTDVFQILIKNYLKLLIPGALICSGLFYVEAAGRLNDNHTVYFTGKFLAGLIIVLFTLGFIGFFLRFFYKENKTWRYISDASYWAYLIHMGFVTAIQLYFIDSNMPGILRFCFAFIIPLLISFATYHWFVRYTFIGNMLHGKREKQIIDNQYNMRN
ncbi:MAG: acyltransferase family protein [Agriterribacter sp.]